MGVTIGLKRKVRHEIGNATLDAVPHSAKGCVKKARAPFPDSLSEILTKKSPNVSPVIIHVKEQFVTASLIVSYDLGRLFMFF